MINVKQAVQAAIDYVQHFKDIMHLYDARLEETEYDDEYGMWNITISFTSDMIAFSDKRIFKSFRVDGESGAILSMKNTK